MPDPYSKIALPPAPEAPAGLRYAFNRQTDTNFVLLLPSCDPRLVASRQVMVSVAGGEYVRYRAGPRETEIRLRVGGNQMVAAYVIDVNSVGQAGPRGPTATYQAILPDIRISGNTFSGNGTPDDAYGVNDDLYVDMCTGNVYKKANDTWY